MYNPWMAWGDQVFLVDTGECMITLSPGGSIGVDSISIGT